MSMSAQMNRYETCLMCGGPVLNGMPCEACVSGSPSPFVKPIPLDPDYPADFAARTNRDEVARLTARVAELEERLEISHAFRMVGDEMVRFEIPEDERDSFPDGIEARDCTISMIEAANAKLRARVAELEAVLLRIAVGANDDNGPEVIWMDMQDMMELALAAVRPQIMARALAQGQGE